MKSSDLSEFEVTQIRAEILPRQADLKTVFSDTVINMGLRQEEDLTISIIIMILDPDPNTVDPVRAAVGNSMEFHVGNKIISLPIIIERYVLETLKKKDQPPG